ncbi:hypothetical protein McanMca71_000555 [Microsporum canis]|uniref:Stress response RCI peptide n=1 Tax=Arthroderma otae (strain ATCC MYA-4605 / CBS 113480) TaxID=554155 RepID=C5FM41_ARTOC|nr:conserved hypothetical protein [Microsporum canis CBS 113480]EEQ30763.1 conserved hypothetical protein [Microsporum canis CBS 113480]
MCSPDAFLAILAVLFPPIAVWIKVGVCSADSLINIALCCLGYVPGLLHAWYIILKYPEADDEYPDGYRPIVGQHRGDAEAGRVTYYYIAHEQAHPNQHQQHQQQRTYGTNVNPESRPAPSPPVPQKPQRAGGGYAATGAQDQGSSSRPEGEHRSPPTYAEAVKGDNKIQS